MNAYAMWDRAEDIREAQHVRQVMQEEEEAKTTEWFKQSLTLNALQRMATEALGAKIEFPAAITETFDDDCEIRDDMEVALHNLAAAIARRHIKIKNEDYR